MTSNKFLKTGEGLRERQGYFTRGQEQRAKSKGPGAKSTRSRAKSQGRMANGEWRKGLSLCPLLFALAHLLFADALVGRRCIRLRRVEDLTRPDNICLVVVLSVSIDVNLDDNLVRLAVTLITRIEA